MNTSRFFFPYILIGFLIPVIACPSTFDQYGIPKLALFSVLIAISLAVVLIGRQQLNRLPWAVKTAVIIFILAECFQTLRLKNPVEGFFGEYGQSESLLVQMGFILIFLASYLLFSFGNPFRPFRTAILAAIYLISFYGIFEYFMMDPITHLPVLRVKSLLGDPNSLGVFLVLTLPILFWDMASEKRDTFSSRSRFFLSSFGIFLGIINLFLTFSRASWLGFLATLLIFSSFLLIKRQKNLFLLKIICLIIILGGLCGEGLTQLQPRSHSDYELHARIASVTQGKDSGRKYLWSTARTIFKTSPVAGYGIGTFQDLFHRYETVTAVNHWSPERDLREAHNETLHYLATQGLIGLMAYFGLIFVLGYTAWRKWRQPETDTGRMALISAIIGYFIFVQFAYPLLHYTYLFWVYWGILLADPFPGQVSPSKKRPNYTVMVFIGFLFVGSFGFSYRIYRADSLYLKAFTASHAFYYKKALRYFPEIISQNPWVYQYRYRYAVTLIRAARQAERRSQQALSSQYIDQAQSILHDLQRTHPSRYQIPFLSAEVWESRHNYSKANALYRQSARLFPSNYKLWYRIAKTELSLGHKQKAQSAWQTGLKLNRRYMISSGIRDHLKELLPRN